MSRADENPRYERAVIAVDLSSTRANRLYERVRPLVDPAGIHLLHVMRMESYSPTEAFSPDLTEEEYWRCEAQLRDCGQALHIGTDRQALLVGDFSERIAEYVARNDIDLLVVGEPQDGMPFPVDGVAAALGAATCDVMMVADHARG